MWIAAECVTGVPGVFASSFRVGGQNDAAGAMVATVLAAG